MNQVLFIAFSRKHFSPTSDVHTKWKAELLKLPSQKHMSKLCDKFLLL